MSQGKRTTLEFRCEAVQLALTRGGVRREITNDLGVGLSTLTWWVSQDRNADEAVEDQPDFRAELKRLRKRTRC